MADGLRKSEGVARAARGVTPERGGGPALLLVRVLSPGVSQTAVHLAEIRRKYPDVGEVDCTLSKVGCMCSRAALCRGCVSARGLGRTSKLRDNTGHRALSCPAGVDSPPSGPAESSRLRRVALRGHSHCRHDADDGQVFRRGGILAQLDTIADTLTSPSAPAS